MHNLISSLCPGFPTKSGRIFLTGLWLIFGLVSMAQSPVSIVIGNTAGTGNWFFGPIFRNTTNAGTLNFSRHAYLYTAAELGIPAGARIIRLEWLKKDGGTIVAPNTWNLWLTNTTSTSFPTTSSWSNLLTGATPVYTNTNQAVTIGNNAYLTANFNVPGNDSFTYTGGNLQILTDWAKQGLQTGSGINFYVSAASGRAIGIAATTPMTGATVLQAGTYGNSRPTIRITYVPVPPCSGTPNPGATQASVSSACAGVPFTLNVQNTIPGSGVSYQWQRSDDASFTTNVVNLGTGATQVSSITGSTYYRCLVTCSGSGITQQSTPLLVALSAHYDCYCPSSASTDADEEILNVTFGSMSNSSTCTTIAPGPGSIPQMYSNYKGFVTPPNVEQLSTVPFSITVGTCLNLYPNRTAIYIDYNHNAVFEASEQVFQTPNAVNGPNVQAGNIIIPQTATTGLTGLRVITIEQSLPITNPCQIYSFGETEDYLINITPTTNCSGTPTPGNTLSNMSSVCSGKTINLSLQNATTGQGVSYQWFNRLGAIPGATSFNYTSAPIFAPDTFYCAVSCSFSGLTSNSIPFAISMAPFIDCYCTSVAGNDADVDIYKFTFNNVLTWTDCNTVAPGPGSILSRYSNFRTLGSITTLDLGASVPFDIELDDCDQSPYYSGGTAIFIDYNQNGSYADPGERVYVDPIVDTTPRHVIGNFIIPCTANTGLTGMRVMVVEGLAGSLINSCMSYGFGETEDYIINIKKPDTCSLVSNPPGNTQANKPPFFCDSSSFNLSLQNKCLFENFTYQWFQGNFPGVAIPGATNKTYTTPVLTSMTTFYCQVSCGSGNMISAPLTFQKLTITPQPYASSNAYCIGGQPIKIKPSHTSSPNTVYPVTYSILPTSGLSPGNGDTLLATPTTTTTYTLTATNTVLGCIGTTTLTIQAAPLPVTLQASSTNYCTPNGTAVTLTAGGGDTYSYLPVTGLSSDSGITVQASPTSTTTYTVTGTSTDGCSNTATVTIQSAPLPVTLTPANSVFCLSGGDPVTLVAGGGVTYTYDPPAGLSASSGDSVVATPLVTTTYTVTGTEPGGCSNTATATVQVSSLSVNVSASQSVYCMDYGTPVTLTATGASTYTYSPSFGLSSTEGASVLASPSSTTTYTVTGTDPAGCTNSATITIQAVSVNATLNASSNSFCTPNGVAVTLTAGGGTSYVYTPSAGLSVDTGAIVIATPNTTTTYTVQVTDVSGCTNTAVTTIAAAPLPVTLQASNLNYCTNNGTAVTLTGGGATNYTYEPTQSLSASSGDSVLATPAITTTYTVTGTEPGGCSNTATVTVQAVTLTVGLTASSTSYCTPNGTPVSLSGSGATTYTYLPSQDLTAASGDTVWATPSQSTTFTVTGTDVNGCTGTATASIVVSPCNLDLSVKVIVEGFYDGMGLMKPVLLNQGVSLSTTVTDSITVALHSDMAPYGQIAASTVELNTNGVASVSYPGLNPGNFYIVISHRNGLQTWSANPVFVNGGLYDFTTSDTSAFGNNMKQVDTGIWAIYSGDVTADENIDLLDIGLVELDVTNFEFGYKTTDINGDGNVDLLDVPVLEANVNNFIFVIKP